jgi:uncharacterized protein (TIGR03435 family)
MRKRDVLLIVGVVAIAAFPRLGAQAPSGDAKPPAFEVASIKPNTSQDRFGGSDFSAGRYVGRNVTARRVIGLAFQPLLGNQILGGPDWINTDRFDIDARASGDRPAAQLRLMMQSLLVDRFKLGTHRETRELPIYQLVMARGDRKLGERLRPSQTNCVNPGDRPAQLPIGQQTIPQCEFTFTDTALRGKGATMETLSRELSFVGRVVVDKTNLAGPFDLDFE